MTTMSINSYFPKQRRMEIVDMERNYTELSRLKTLGERFEYLKLNGIVGEELFGYARYLNQEFYHGAEWQDVRQQIIIRDGGYDLGGGSRLKELFTMF